MDLSFQLSIVTLFLHLGLLRCLRDQDIGTTKSEIGPKNVPIVVLSQSNLYHARRAEIFKHHLLDQVADVKISPGDIHLLHEEFYHIGSWTILPIIPDLLDRFGQKDAVLFCEEETRIDLDKLYTSLGRYDFSQELFLGRGLRDKEATIIHHFAFHESPSSFVYPDFAAGFILSMPLIRSLAARMKDSSKNSDFAIDPKHELAMYIWNDGEGLRMQEVDFLCIYPDTVCGTEFPTHFPRCGKSVSEDDVLFAVKTCEKFHKDRVPVVKSTWGQDSKHIEFYSDKLDDTIPTIDLGIPNTDRGHCSKTLAIIKRFRENRQHMKKQWLVIADDDSLISVRRLYELLSCYDPTEPIALGERYGYGVKRSTGYNYITGGGGMVFSRQTVQMLMDLEMCECAADDDPDDMILGLCLQRLGIVITHSPLFHQARPMDYARGYLEHQDAVSFHKHWMADPYQIYNTWLTELTRDEL